MIEENVPIDKLVYGEGHEKSLEGIMLRMALLVERYIICSILKTSYLFILV